MAGLFAIILDNQDKIQAMKSLEALSEEKVFRKKRITLKGYILTETPIKNIPVPSNTIGKAFERITISFSRTLKKPI